LKYLYCNFNKIESIDYLPDNLIELNCSKNLLSKLPDLPDNLIKLNIKGNKFTNIDNLPFGLRELNISGNKINKIYSFNVGLEKIVVGYAIYSYANIYDLPNMLISLENGTMGYKNQSVYDQLVNKNFNKFI
jgi:Leucine-rich repeat (LRR) protein